MSFAAHVHRYLSEVAIVSGAKKIGIEPDTPDDVITFFDTGGGAADTDQMDIFRPAMQVRVRSKDYAVGFAKQREIRKALLNARFQFDGVMYLGIQLTSDIAFLQQDERNRYQFVASYEAITQEE